MDAWLQLVLATLARDNNLSPLNTHHIKQRYIRARSTSPPTMAMSPMYPQLPVRLFFLPDHLPPIPEETPQFTALYAASLYPRQTLYLTSHTPAHVACNIECIDQADKSMINCHTASNLLQ